jgi:hypothetical protein
MPLFIDVHHNVPAGLSPEALEAMHKKDVAVEGTYGVRYLKYWYDAATGKVFCLSDAPDLQSAMAVHRAAHGAPADEYFEVQEGR